MIGISDLKNSLFFSLALCIVLFSSCEDKKKKTDSSEQIIPAKTNIRFATKKDGFKEKSSYKRLKTDKTEVTSTIFQMEGPAWENENVGFRNYFDARNGMDIFGKRTQEMVLDSVGIDENYHELHDWGMDVLKVGNSLGAGAIALIINDSIYRIGVGSDAGFRIVEETPTSSSLEFTFKDWKVQDRTYQVSNIISISAGTHYYESTVNIEGLTGDEMITSGIVNHNVGTKNISTGKYTILSTHGGQDVEHKNLGMAIAIDNAFYAKVDSAASYKGNVDNTHLILSNKNNVSFKFFAGWELENPKFESKEYFEDVIKRELNN